MISLMYVVRQQLRGRKLAASSIFRQLNPSVKFTESVRRAYSEDNKYLSSLFTPVHIKSNKNDTNIGAELTGSLQKNDILQVLCNFANKDSVKQLAAQYGLDNIIFTTAITNFRRYCVESNTLPADLHIVLSDIIQNVGNVTDIFPYFLRFAKEVYPHIDCLDDLKKISDLRNPANWYPIARAKVRKIIFHAGPTNSGKTYHALQRFISAKSGVYCGPLKLLAHEVYNKTNSLGTPCDLLTGEEHRYGGSATSPAKHMSCSVEMANIQDDYEVAVIDEIQLIRDANRGWAWTRALLGLAANEIHLCGEAAAIPIVQYICSTTGESVEVRKYERLTELEIERSALCSVKNVQPGDCIVCFSRNEIYSVSKAIENIGRKVAVIYGSLPPGTKIAQAKKFNDVKDTCKVLVATNAIGMGLNLHIRRIIFYTLVQPTLNEKGEMEVNTIPVSTALQIAGRAGRYGTQWTKGYVTTFKPEDLPLLRSLLRENPEPISQAGLHPTADQIELYAYYLPNAPLSNLINIFIALCKLDDSLYFICNLDDFKFLADMLQHVPLPLRTRYIMCCAPVNRKIPFTCTMFLKFARRCSNNESATVTWLNQHINWPPQTPTTINDLLRLESVFDVLDIYLWLSYRMPDLFPDRDNVKGLQKELDNIIETGITRLTALSHRKEADKVHPEQRQQLNKVEDDIHKSFEKRKLSNTLISRGLLTPQMLRQLKMEWSTEHKGKISSEHKLYNYNKYKHHR